MKIIPKFLFIPEKIKQNLLDWFPSDLCHDGAFSSKILITQAQEVVDNKGCRESYTHTKIDYWCKINLRFY